MKNYSITPKFSVAFWASTNGDSFEIKFNDRNQVYDKIAWGLSGEFLCFHTGFICKYTTGPTTLHFGCTNNIFVRLLRCFSLNNKVITTRNIQLYIKETYNKCLLYPFPFYINQIVYPFLNSSAPFWLWELCSWSFLWNMTNVRFNKLHVKVSFILKIVLRVLQNAF